MSDDDEEVVDVAASAGALDPVVVLLREFIHRSGAVRAVAAVDRGPETLPAVVDVAQLAPIEIEDGEHAYVLPHAIELDVEELPVPDVRQLPRFDIDALTAEVTAPLGGMEHYADAVRALARTIGGRTVVLVTFASSDPDLPMSLSGREGEPLLVTLGEDTFEMPDA